MGVHESHKKRFCQGCYRFTHLPLASTQADEPPSEGHPDGATMAADASTQPQTGACADVSQAQPTSLTDQVVHDDGAPDVTTSTATAAEEKKQQQQQQQKVSRKCTAQVWCERCRQSWYCSLACKEQDRLHPLQCPGLAFLASCKLTKDDKTVVRVLLHVLARRELEAIDGPPPAGGVSGKPRFADFLCLVANVPSLAISPDRYKGDMEVVRYVEKMLASCSLAHKYTSQELMEYISKIESNTFGMWSDKLVSMGMVLYAEGSYFNHSCAPNCGTRTGEGQAVQFVATHDIPAGDEVCIRYIDVDKPTTSRRSELLSHYHFTCMCPLCCADSSSSSSSASSSSAKTKHSHHPARPGKVGKKGKKVKAARKGK